MRYLIFLIFSLFIISCGDNPCSICNGNGTVISDRMISQNCDNCSGKGYLICDYTFENTGFASATTYKCSNGKYIPLSVAGFNTGQLSGHTCSKCNGNGKLKCTKCSGHGKISKVEKTEENCALCSGTGRVSKLQSLFK